MRVKTLLGEEFKNGCKRLCEEIQKDYSPDVVIGVLTGGGHVGREISQHLVTFSNYQYVEIKVQRKDTKKKEKGVYHKVLQILPYFLLNWLRMAEMLYEDVKAKKSNPKREGTIELPANVDAYLKEDRHQILLVDDAIDTGATLKLIKDWLTENYPLASVRIAVVTVTSNHPLIDADYCLYHDRTLVRFPWSNDVKKGKV